MTSATGKGIYVLINLLDEFKLKISDVVGGDVNALIKEVSPSHVYLSFIAI